MKYSFKDINEPSMYKECRVMFVTGQYNTFNNIVVDKLKSMCSTSIATNLNESLLQEFGIDTSEQITVSNIVDIETFINVCESPSVSGLWFCSVDLASMTKKQQEWLKNYVKKPSEYGILVVVSNEFKHYRLWLSNKNVISTPEVNLIQLSFPNRDNLRSIVVQKFYDRNVRIQERALDLFIVRMSNSYDDYDRVIEKICSENLPEDYLIKTNNKVYEITYEMAFYSLRGIENFVIDDFIEKLTEPLSSDTVTARKPIYKMMGYLVEEYGARKLVNILIKRIDELLEFRIAINKGYIPVIVNYNVEESKKMLGEESELTKKSDFQFKRLSKIAAKTSLQDWAYMKMILMNTNKYSDDSYVKALYSLVSRSVLTNSRINNDIGINTMLKGQLKYIDKIAYVDQE